MTWAEAFSKNINKILIGLVLFIAIAVGTVTGDQLLFMFERALFLFLSKNWTCT